jgi:hypothetical protein
LARCENRTAFSEGNIAPVTSNRRVRAVLSGHLFWASRPEPATVLRITNLLLERSLNCYSNREKQVLLKNQGVKQMLWTIFVILLVLWLLGLVTSYTFGGFIHILLVIAIAVVLIQLITGRRAV